jgi:hypothetical protein
MMRVRSLRVLRVVVLLATATAAHAEEDGLRRFHFRPSVQTRAVLSDNIGAVDHGRDSDVGIWIAPRVELGFREEAYELGVDASLDVRRYTERSGFDEVFYRVHSQGEIGLLPGLSLRLSDAYTPQPVALGLPDDEPANLVQTNRARLELRYWRELASGRELTAGLVGGRLDTERFATLVAGPGGTPVADPGFKADFWEGGGFLELHNPLGDDHGAYLRGLVRHRSFDDRAGADHMEASALLGFRSQLEPGLALDVAGGWGWLDLRDGGSDSRSLARAALSLRRPDGWHFELGFHNEFTIDVAGNDFVDTTGRLQVEKYFGRRTAASVTGFLSYLTSDSSQPGSNLFGGAEIAVRRQLSRRFQLGFAYRYWQNAGAFSGDDLRQNRGMLTLSYRH